jgi:hypothetical protein
MKTLKYSQFGTVSVALLIPLLVFILAMLLFSRESDTAFVIVMTLVILSLVFCILIFYKLTIFIDDSRVSFKMGIGLVKKEYALSNIAYCKPVKNAAWYGIGIHITTEGWLYNVSGLYAIELGFRNRKKIRIGTDKPEEISQIITQLITKSDPGLSIDTSHQSYNLFVVAVILLGLFLPLIMIFSGIRDTKLEYSDSCVKIKGMYGKTISYLDITNIDTISSLPRIKIKTNGFAFGKSLRGNFRLYDQTRVKLFIKKGSPPYIFIKTNEYDIYLNFLDSASTKESFRKITSAM